MNMSEIEILSVEKSDLEELAIKITGLEKEEDDPDVIEEELINQLGIDLDGLHNVVERLLPLINVAKSPLSDELYKGFADKTQGLWLIKTHVNPTT